MYVCYIYYLGSLELDYTHIPGQFCSYYELLLKATTTLSTNKEPRVSPYVV